MQTLRWEKTTLIPGGYMRLINTLGLNNLRSESIQDRRDSQGFKTSSIMSFSFPFGNGALRNKYVNACLALFPRRAQHIECSEARGCRRGVNGESVMEERQGRGKEKRER